MSTIVATVLVFVLVGAPLGIRVKRGGLTVAFLSIIFFLFYFLSLIAGEGLAERLFITPAAAMWVPNVVLFGVGLWWTLSACDVRLRRAKSAAEVAA